MPSKLFLLADVLRFILNHPLNRRNKPRALGRFMRWQVGSRLAPGPVIIPFVEQTRLIARPGLMGATGIYYTGLYEFEEMAFVLHALRAQDRFIDVGAHIGAFSVLAAGAVGATCLAIEPVPASFASLQENLNLNGLGSQVQALNIGLAARAGRLRFTTGRGAANGVLPPGKEAQPGLATVEVAVQPLDAVMTGSRELESTGRIVLKVDVEGFEQEVIAGGEVALADPRLFAILIELRGHGARYGFDENAIHQRLLSFGFQPYAYTPSIKSRGEGKGDRGELHPEERVLTPLEGINRETGTTIYIRDLALARERIASAPNFFVHGQYV
jgi:FkbM family methyltransferase